MSKFTAVKAAKKSLGRKAAIASMSAAVFAAALNGPVKAAGNDACIPHDMPSADTVLNSSKKAFAHYFYPFPVSLDNLPSGRDYYTTQYLNPNGESNKFLTQGGFLRARPLPLNPQSDSSWQLRNMRSEVRLAIARGLNGFSFDVMSVGEANPGGKLQMMLQAAKDVDGRFKILLMPDMSALGPNTSAVMSIVKAAYSHPSLYRLGDGRVVLSPFNSEAVSPSGWASLLNSLRSQGYNVAFLPTFGSIQQTYVNAYAPISVGLGNWAKPGTPDQKNWTINDGPLVKKSSAPIFLAGIVPQNYRPKDFIFDEAFASLAYRNGWLGIIGANADIAHISTWNDFSESSQIAPVTNQYGDRGSGYYNLTGYYAAWFHTGRQPAITHDVLYYFYRKQSYRGATTQSQPTRTSYPQPQSDQLEVLAFLTQPGTITVTIGSTRYTKDVAAGMQSVSFHIMPGVPDIRLTRGGSTVVKVSGNHAILPDYATLPNGALDLTYWSGSASSAGDCVVAMP